MLLSFWSYKQLAGQKLSKLSHACPDGAFSTALDMGALQAPARLQAAACLAASLAASGHHLPGTSCEIGSWPESRETLGRGCFPHPRCFRGPSHSGLAQHGAEQDSWTGRPAEEPAIFSETRLGDTSLQLPEVPRCPPGKERHKQNNTTHLPNLLLESMASIKCNYLILNQGQLLLHAFAVPSGLSERVGVAP